MTMEAINSLSILTGKVDRELQGLKTVAVAGAAANTQMNISAIRTEDTLVSVTLSDGGALSDITGTTTIVDLRATGTITVGTAVANDTVTVNAKVYKWVAALSRGDTVYQVKLGADANANAAALAAAINAYDGNAVTATASSNVVTVTANAEGTGGNAYTLAETGSSVTVSGATLAGGSATGGIKNSVDTSAKTVLVTYFNKR